MIIKIQLKAEKIASIIQTVSQLVEICRELPGNTEGKAGGYLTVLDPTNCAVQLISPIGEIIPEKIDKYLSFSQEKAFRLSNELINGHLSSWESRNPDQGMWGGAIYAYAHIYSFSGLPELADEAVMLVNAILQNDLSEEIAAKIAERSSNKFFTELLAAVKNN